MTSEYDILKNAALEAGWTITRAGGRADCWAPPRGQGRRFYAAGPNSGHSEVVSLRGQLKRNGLVIAEETPVAKQPSPNREYQKGDRLDAIHTGVRGGNHPLTAKDITPEGRQAVAEFTAELLTELGPDIEMERRIAVIVEAQFGVLADAVDENNRDRDRAITTLEAMVGEVADSLKRLRESYQESLPPLRRDVKELREQLALLQALPEKTEETISAQLLVARAKFDTDLEERLSQAEGDTLGLIDQLEQKLTARIQVAQAAASAKADPLSAIRKRLGEGN